MRFAKYMRFYQSLSPSQYERLNTTDKFIDQQYLIYMLHDYYQQCGEEAYVKLMDGIKATGVSMERLQEKQRYIDEAMQQRAAQEQAQAQAQEEESSAAMEEMLGQ